MITVYAQNFEDVYLWRALGHVEHGRYVDVGAHDPDHDSVTRLFYEAGWRGINIEPVPTMAEQLVARRPDDVVVRAACGETEGEVTLYEVVGTGLSTRDPDDAEEIRKLGRTVIAHQTPLVTLNSLLTQHGGDPVHFLKIDVQGAVRSVLEGCDFSIWRPWVLVIDATKPLSREQNDHEWEPLVTDARYEKVLFDGLNNYYVAQEHSELRGAFALPPNIFDDFVLPSGHGLVEQSDIEAFHRDAAALAQKLEDARAAALDFEELARSTEQWAKSTEAQLKVSEKQAAEALTQAAEATRTMRRMRHSFSWAVTAPLRAVPTAARESGKIAVPKAKRALRPALDAGLRVVRRNDLVLRMAKKVASRVPSLDARLRAFASARPAPEDSQ